MHPGDPAGVYSELEMTWLLYCAGAATVNPLRYDRPLCGGKDRREGKEGAGGRNGGEEGEERDERKTFPRYISGCGLDVKFE